MAEVETVLLANHAEAVNGLLYLAGGGWTHHWRGVPQPGQPMPPSTVAFASTITAPATEPPAAIPFTVRITGADGAEVMRAEGTLSLGAGDSVSTKRAAFAGNFGIAFPADGRYELTVEIPGSRRSVEFWVHDQPMPPPGQGPQSGQAQHGGRSDPTPGYI
ncbi:MAG: hypothetical protein ABR518_07850 [Actinomycetota bacterium]